MRTQFELTGAVVAQHLRNYKKEVVVETKWDTHLESGHFSHLCGFPLSAQLTCIPGYQTLPETNEIK